MNLNIYGIGTRGLKHDSFATFPMIVMKILKIIILDTIVLTLNFYIEFRTMIWLVKINCLSVKLLL